MKRPVFLEASYEGAVRRVLETDPIRLSPETIARMALDYYRALIAIPDPPSGDSVASEEDACCVGATWDRPDFADSRFAIERVDQIAECRHEGCERLPEFRVEYTMRREPWTYEYECGYCVEHMPQAAIDWMAEN